MKNKLWMIFLLCFVLKMISANPVGEDLYTGYFAYNASDVKSDGMVAVDQAASIYLARERIEVRIDDYDRAYVEASYTLKNEGPARTLLIQLPFMEKPSDLKIECNDQVVAYEENFYLHNMKGFPGYYDRTAKYQFKRDIIQLMDPVEKKLEMDSASFLIPVKDNADTTFKATYYREMSFYSSVKEGDDEAEYLEAYHKLNNNERPEPFIFYERFYALDGPYGHFYNYTYLFQTGLTWPKPIDQAELIIKIKKTLIKQVVTEEDLKKYGSSSMYDISNSGSSLILFNEDGSRQTVVLAPASSEGEYEVFRFEKENWRPTQNAGVIFLGHKRLTGKDAERPEPESSSMISDEELEKVIAGE